jgi:hypothetical protein
LTDKFGGKRMRNYILFSVLLLFFNSCNKNNSSDVVKIDTQILVSENASEELADEINLVELAEERAAQIRLSLFEYFQNDQFIIFDEPLDVKFRKINFAVHFFEENQEIADVIVGFELTDEGFHRYLLIKDYKFINRDNTILYNFSRGYDGIYGFNFSYSYPTVEGYTPGLNIYTFFDNGKRVADSFTIQWNEDIKTFEKVKWF